MNSSRHGVAQATITWQAAQAVADQALRYAQTIGLKVNVAVVDASVVLATFLHSSGAPLHSGQHRGGQALGRDAADCRVSGRGNERGWCAPGASAGHVQHQSALCLNPIPIKMKYAICTDLHD